VRRRAPPYFTRDGSSSFCLVPGFVAKDLRMRAVLRREGDRFPVRSPGAPMNSISARSCDSPTWRGSRSNSISFVTKKWQASSTSPTQSVGVGAAARHLAPR